MEVDLPADAFQHRPWDPITVGAEMRLLWLIEQVRERRLGYARAAEMADVPIARFVQQMSRHGVGPFDYDLDELTEELGPIS